MIYLLGAVLVGSAVAKFAQIPKVVSQMNAAGFDSPRLMLIVMLEADGAILFMMPRTQVLGLLLVSAYLGGAIAYTSGTQPVA